MPTTPNRAYEYPANTDQATIPAHMGRYLTQIDADMQTVMDEQSVVADRITGVESGIETVRTVAVETRALDEVKRVTLTKSTVVDVSAWDKDRAHVLVVTQDQTGGRALTHDGKPVRVAKDPGAATVTAWVWDGDVWVWRSSEPEPVPTEAPVWPSGASARVTPAHDHATVVFTVAVPDGATVQWRAGAGDSWRNLTMTGVSAGVITGLTPATVYPGVDFQLVNVVGSSEVISVPGFSTAAKPLAWEVTHRASFDTAHETPLADYQPELGGKLTVNNGDRAQAVAVDGHTEVRYTTANYPNLSVGWPVTWGDKNMRLTCAYSGATTASSQVRLGIATNKSPVFSVAMHTSRITISSPPDLGGTGAAATETTGNTTMPPASGTATLTADDDVFTLTIDGQVYRRWEVTWGTNYGAISYYTNGSCGIGGGDLHAGKTVSDVQIDEFKIERWQ